jgi:hypothetical protein
MTDQLTEEQIEMLKHGKSSSVPYQWESIEPKKETVTAPKPKSIRLPTMTAFRGASRVSAEVDG